MSEYFQHQFDAGADPTDNDEPLCDECRRPIGDDDGCCRCGEREEAAHRREWRRGLGI